MIVMNATVTTSLEPVQLDQARMQRAAGDLFGVLSAYLPAGLREWAKVNRPDVMRYLVEDKEAVETAAKFGTGEDFLSALDVCLRHHQAAVRIYRRELGSKAGVQLAN